MPTEDASGHTGADDYGSGRDHVRLTDARLLASRDAFIAQIVPSASNACTCANSELIGANRTGITNYEPKSDPPEGTHPSEHSIVDSDI